MLFVSAGVEVVSQAEVRQVARAADGSLTITLKDDRVSGALYDVY